MLVGIFAQGGRPSESDFKPPAADVILLRNYIAGVVQRPALVVRQRDEYETQTLAVVGIDGSLFDGPALRSLHRN